MPCLTLRAVQLNPFSCKKSYIVECSANFVTIEAFLTMYAARCVLLCPVLCIYFYYILYIYAVCATLCASLQLYSFESSFQMQLLLVFVKCRFVYFSAAFRLVSNQLAEQLKAT